MSVFRLRSLAAALALTAVLSASRTASAASAIVTWELAGVNSPVTSVPATTMAAGVTGTPITRSAGLSDVAGSTNSFNSMGWNTAGQFVDLGFTLTPGSTATVNEFMFASRSSATGPGSMSVEFSVDGGAFMTVSTITQPDPATTTNNGFVNTDLMFAPIAVHSSLDVRFAVTPFSLAANGGPISSAGTWRISDFFNGSTFQPAAIRGTVVPEPSSFALGGIALVSLAILTRARRKRTARA